MNLLFLTLLGFDSIQERGIYTDLLREFVKYGHNVYAVSPVERRKQQNTHIIKEDKATILKLRIGNIQKTNIIEKGISTVLIEATFKNAIKRYFSTVKFDLVLYSTPPITLVSAIEYVKNRDSAKSYLLLKDIFPQNALDINLLSKNGLKGLLYRRFRNQEKRLYEISDHIGCMSEANVCYVIKHNPEVLPQKVEVCPNSIDIIDKSVDEETRALIRYKYNMPLEKKVFVYGGNLGKPQGVPFLLECIKKCSGINNAFFLIVGDGTEYSQVESFVNDESHNNVKLMRRLPKEEYDTLVGACDVGLIFLDHRFTIPNFPSRLLSYMQAKLPVLAVTDPNTDVGAVIVNGGFGWWCESNDVDKVVETIKRIVECDTYQKGVAGYNYLYEFYSSKCSFDIITNSISE